MVPDFISYNKKYNNWRDAKPPVAAWGAMNVYKATGDKKFLETMFDKLYKFHQWWYAERDHNHNGICEYGSTDGTLIAACWESGMDNGVRFDDAVMQKKQREGMVHEPGEHLPELVPLRRQDHPRRNGNPPEQARTGGTA